MAKQTEGNLTFIAGEALERCRRVKLHSSAGQVVYSDAGEDFIGVTQEVAASGAQVSVKPFNATGTTKVTAAGAVTAHAAIYGAVDGKIDDAVAGIKIGYALEAALADGDIIECLIDKNAGESWS